MSMACKLSAILILGLAWLATPSAGAASPGATPLIIDNEAPLFSQRGFNLTVAADAQGGRAMVRPAGVKTAGVARYQPGLSGAYDVYLYWGDYADLSTDINWTVKHTRGVTQQPFNQRHTPGWHFHGSYQLDTQSYVELNVPAGRRHDDPVVADAVKFIPTVPRIIERSAKDTLTPVTLNPGDELRFKLRSGRVCPVKLLETGAQEGKPYRFWARLLIDGEERRIERVIPTQASFYEPLEIRGLRLWLDAVSDIFTDDGGFMIEKDISGAIACRPQRKARLAVNDVHDRICPEPLVFWYPEKKRFIDASKCYNGEDVWMGPYEGRKTHGGLDINMTSGTLLFAPIAFDDQYFFNSLAAGDNNNRWRAIRRWDNGAVWWLQSHHLNRLLIDERKPLARGTKYAETAGVYAGSHQHTHFVFRVFEEGESYFLDPWILFWQMFRDREGM